VLAAEIGALPGATSVRAERGRVLFRGGLDTGYAACLWLRCASRVSELLLRERPAGSRQQLYDAIRAFDWSPVIDPDLTLAIHTSVRDSAASDERFVSLVIKDAIVDAQRDQHGRRSSVSTDDPDVPLRVVVQHDRATVLRDLGGTSLHRRGWRPIQVKSPLNEAIAAGLLQLAGWTGEGALFDPMCGSGTFVVEAAHIAQDRAPGLRRSFAFERWPDLERKAWANLRHDAVKRAAIGRRREVTIAGADHHDGALSIARLGVEAAGVSGIVELRKGQLDTDAPPWRPTLVVSNPPWGRRLGGDGTEETWQQLGQFLKTHCGGALAYLLSGDADLTRALRMKAARRHPVQIGPVDARWIRYEILAPRATSTP
jgi:putative N6-adenine-specific DNA methylase